MARKSVAHGNSTSGKKKSGVTKANNPGAHLHTPHGKMAPGATKDVWKHKAQARGQG
jgi:hypothetical protein